MGVRIPPLQAALPTLPKDLLSLPKGRHADVWLATFGSRLTVHADFVKPADLTIPELAADGPTPYALAIDAALDAIDKRDEAHAAAELLPYTPQLILFADGIPEGEPAEEVERARVRLVKAQKDRRLLFTAFAVGDGCDREFLRSLSAKRSDPRPVAGDRASFVEAFVWVSRAAAGGVRTSHPAPEQKPFPD
jgi:uncharacterized protein YegL